MKNIFTVLREQMPGRQKEAAIRVGSDADPIRQMLFACQPLPELVARLRLNEAGGPYRSMADAAKLVEEGRREEAAAQLLQVLKTPDLETRMILWIWSALRALGFRPGDDRAFEVLGAVIEVPSGGAYDTLAAYVDGRARYLNFSGRAILWDVTDLSIQALCQATVDSTIPPSSRATPRTSLALPNAGSQVTLLTRSGLYSFGSPPEAVFRAGAALMTELMNRARDREAR